MAEFTLETARDRKLTVKVEGGEIYLRVAKYNGISEYGFEQSYLSPHQAVQIAHALLNVAEGKEADADRTDDSAVRLLEQRMSALEGELQEEAAKRAASIATIVAEIADKYSGVTVTVKEPEQKFYLKLTDDAYINLFTDEDVEGVIYVEDKSQTTTYQTQFTQAEIDSNPELKKFDSFKIPVPSAELAE